MAKACAGNNEKSDRSDCKICLSIEQTGGVQIALKSKVGRLYGKSIKALCCRMLAEFNIEHANLEIEDQGAPEYVIAARLEYCIRQVSATDMSWLPDALKQNCGESAFDRFRRSRLYLPGNTPKLALNAGLHSGDGIILDLEDSVAPDKKDEARILVRNTLRAVDFYGAERMVRINQGSRGQDDLDMLLPHGVQVILLPKCESAQQVLDVADKIDLRIKEGTVKGKIWIMPIIESARGVLKSLEIAEASPLVIALAVGLEDYTADLGAPRTQEGRESFFARCQVVNACRAAGIQAIDSVYSDVGNMEGLRENVLASKALGYDGMGCVHPRQINVIHAAFAPGEKELEKARRIVEAYETAMAQGKGVVALGSKMIDPPVVKRAQKLVALADSM